MEYTREEKLHFSNIVSVVSKALKTTTIHVGNRYRKFNFEITANGVKYHVKCFSHPSGIPDWAKETYRRSKAVYALGEIADLPFPRLVAFDDELEILITEFIEGKGLHEILLKGEAAEARKALNLMATSLADLHGRSAPLREQYRSKLNDFGIRRNTLPNWIQSVNFTEEKIKELVDFGVTSANELAEAMNLLEAYALASQFIGIVNSDLCPDNVYLTDDSIKMIDLDTFDFYYFFIDVYYFRARISCWCVGSLPDQVIGEMEQAYLARLRTYLLISDEEFRLHQLIGALLWFSVDLCMLVRKVEGQWVLDRNSKWGTATLRARVFSRYTHLLSLFPKTIPEDLQVPIMKFKTVIQEVLDVVRTKYKSEQIPFYPAFDQSTI